MKKLLLFVACALSLGACNMTGEKPDAVQEERDSLQRIINEKDMELDDILSTFNEVQEGIRRINEAEGRVTIADGNPERASNPILHLSQNGTSAHARVMPFDFIS